MAQQWSAQGLQVDRRFNLGGTTIAHEALVGGDIDVYVEYTGTALTAIFNEPPSSDSDARPRASAGRDTRRSASPCCRAWGSTTRSRFSIRADLAREQGLGRVSDLARLAPSLTAGFGYEFLERPDGFPGLAAAYGLRFKGAPRVMDLNLIYRAVAAGEIDVTAGDATSGLIEALQLAVSKTIAITSRRTTPCRSPARPRSAPRRRWLRRCRRLEGRITADRMRRMNAAVDRDRQAPADVARAFLQTLP